MLNNLSQAMKNSGQGDVGIGKVDCMINKGLCDEAYSRESKSELGFQDK